MRRAECRTGLRFQSRSKRRESEDQRSEEHTSELQSQSNLVCRLLLEKKKKIHRIDLSESLFTPRSQPVCRSASPASPLYHSYCILAHSFALCVQLFIALAALRLYVYT